MGNFNNVPIVRVARRRVCEIRYEQPRIPPSDGNMPGNAANRKQDAPGRAAPSCIFGLEHLERQLIQLADVDFARRAGH